MITSVRFIVIMIICYKERRILRKRIDNAAARRIAAIFIIYESLGVHGFLLCVSCVCGILTVKISVGIDAGHILHGGGRRRLNTCIQCCCVEGKASPAADTDNADTLGVNILLYGKEIHRRLEILCIDVR